MYFYVAHRDALGFSVYSFGPYPTQRQALAAQPYAPAMPNHPIVYIAQCLTHCGYGDITKKGFMS